MHIMTCFRGLFDGATAMGDGRRGAKTTGSGRCGSTFSAATCCLPIVTVFWDNSATFRWLCVRFSALTLV